MKVKQGGAVRNVHGITVDISEKQWAQIVKANGDFVVGGIPVVTNARDEGIEIKAYYKGAGNR